MGSLQQIAFEFDAPQQPAPAKASEQPLPKSSRGRKSLKAAAEEMSMVQVPEDEILFQKHYYSIGEVASMLNVNPSLLRYWETEFSIIKPRKNKKGDRFYRPEDVKTLQMIQFLLREKKFTLEGAKTFLKKGRQDAENAFALVQSLQQLKALLQSIRADL